MILQFLAEGQPLFSLPQALFILESGDFACAQQRALVDFGVLHVRQEHSGWLHFPIAETSPCVRFFSVAMTTHLWELGD